MSLRGICHADFSGDEQLENGPLRPVASNCWYYVEMACSAGRGGSSCWPGPGLNEEPPCFLSLPKRLIDPIPSQVSCNLGLPASTTNDFSVLTGAPGRVTNGTIR